MAKKKTKKKTAKKAAKRKSRKKKGLVVVPSTSTEATPEQIDDTLSKVEASQQETAPVEAQEVEPLQPGEEPVDEENDEGYF